MDYVLGSVAALVSGNVTPNRPKLLKRALTPTKHQPSPNVTPKSEFVEDRSIFLSPTMQKKKAIVKKSPKRIFQNPDLENTENGEGNLSFTSPKADKVKKHLKDELEADSVANLSTSSLKSPKKKGGNKRESTTTQESNKSVSEQEDNESTPTKKKKKQNSESDTTETVSTLSTVKVSIENTAAVAKSPQKKKQRRKSVVDTDSAKENDISVISNPPTPNKSPKKQDNKSNNSETIEKSNEVTDTSNTNTPKKKNKKRKKKPKAKAAVATTENNDKASEGADKENIQKGNQVASKKKNKKRKKSKGPQNKPELIPTDETKPGESDSEEEGEVNTGKESAETDKVNIQKVIEVATKKNKKRKKSKGPQNKPEPMETDEPQPAESDSEEEGEESTEIKGSVNPNAITDKESDSEHESDDEIESENEEINKKVLEAEKAEESSDEEDEEAQKPQKVEKKEVEKEGGLEKMTKEEIKRTLFVGNVPFSTKVKKDLKKIFNKHGQIETIRIRTVPIKDGSYTPKLAVIKNELHPERTTVNVYIKYADEESVEKALVENNTVLNENHLRVSRSSSTGAEHDPKCSVFIGNLPFAMEDEALRAKFEKCGEIHSVRIIRDKKTNAGKGFGYVNFESKDGVELALALTEEDLTVKNRILRVKRCTQTTTKKKPVKNNDGVKHSGYKGGNHQPNQQGGGFNNQQRGGFNNQASQQRGGFRGNNQGQQQGGGYRGNNQGYQQGGGFRSGNNDNSQQRGGFKPGNQQRSGPPSQGNRQRAFGDRNNQQRGGFNNKFGGQRNQPQKDEQGREGAHRRVMNKRKNQDAAGGDAPPNKKQKDMNEPNKEKKVRKEFVGMTAEKKKKHKVDKGQKKKKALSEILTK